MGKITKKDTNNTQPNDQNKKKRKGRPPKTKYVRQTDSSEDIGLPSTRPRVVSIRRNEIPMRPEIHISPTSIPSSNHPSRNLHQSEQMPLPNDQALSTSATTSSKITITMTSVTTNNTVRSNTTTYVTTEILPVASGS
ncbi:12662_t:CDS:1 [Funneliformis mosseae]|uniref:12662_t:CDS:1 n=1 Tax=Funneliformis mosseae TaxID=27381 RepID=A0A9N9E007_FUNMO|nr:12662_t:CDS:1 [Funneliformis mosseae]